MFVVLAMSFKQWLLATSCLNDPDRLKRFAMSPTALTDLKRLNAADVQKRNAQHAQA